MKIIGSVIARIGSKRLTYKNLLPYRGVPLVLGAIRKLIHYKRIDQVVLSTDSELIARTCMDEKVSIIRRPDSLSKDETPSIPVFQHIIDSFPCDLHLNYNCNFPECPDSVFDQAIDICLKTGESLSDPYAVWAQSTQNLKAYGNPMQITAEKFKVNNLYDLDVHTMDDLLETHRFHQSSLSWEKENENFK